MCYYMCYTLLLLVFARKSSPADNSSSLYTVGQSQSGVLPPFMRTASTGEIGVKFPYCKGA